MNLPTKLTVLRLIMIPLFAAAFFIEALPARFIISAAIFALAAFTDYLDGHIARKYNMVTDLGKFLDPIADKVLVCTALIVMLVDAGGQPVIPFYGAIAVAIIIARELIVSGFRMVAASKGAVLAADWSGKIKTFFQDIAIIVLLVGKDVMPAPYSVMNIIGLALLGAATLLTVYSGAECIIKNGKVLSGGGAGCAGSAAGEASGAGTSVKEARPAGRTGGEAETKAAPPKGQENK